MLAGALIANAQTTGLQWERSFGGSESDFANTVKPTADGGCIIGGYSYSDSSGTKSSPSYGAGDFWLLKLDASGNKQWDQSFGGSNFEGISSLQQTSDGGYILAGTSFSGVSGNKSSISYGSDSGDYWVVKLNGSGNKQWDKSYGGTSLDTVTSVQQTSDGGYIVGGTSRSSVSGNKTSASFGLNSGDYWAVKLDANGNKQWDKSFGGDDADELRSLQQTSDGGYILGGASFSGVSGNKTAAPRGNGTGDYWLVKLDAGGNKQWDKSFGGDDAEELYSVQQTIDGGYILGGHSCSSVSGNKSSGSFGSHDYWLVKLSSDGTRQWDKSYGGNNADELYSVQQSSDGGYILGGTSHSAVSGNKATVSFGSDSGDYWIVKVDANGNKQSEQSVRGSYSGEVLRLQSSRDGGYMLAGLPGPAAAGDLDYGLAKFGAPLHFTSFSFGSARIFQGQLSGMTGTNYILQGSTNLTTWTSLFTNRAANGVVNFAHTNSASASRRFYRVQQQP